LFGFALVSIGGVAYWMIRQGWHWGFREPDANTKDEGGWVTRFFSSTIEANGSLIEASQKLTEASVRHDQKLDQLLARRCLYGVTPPENNVGGSGIHGKK
jgi:hypothetical protein